MDYKEELKNLSAQKRNIDTLQREYEKNYKNLLRNFLKENSLDKYVKINCDNNIGILKVDRDTALEVPYTIRFYLLRPNGAPSTKPEFYHFLITNDLETILENVKPVELEFYNK